MLMHVITFADVKPSVEIGIVLETHSGRIIILMIKKLFVLNVIEVGRNLAIWKFLRFEWIAYNNGQSRSTERGFKPGRVLKSYLGM